jgi:hypothetical protein
MRYSKKMNFEECGMELLWNILKSYRRICVDGLRNIIIITGIYTRKILNSNQTWYDCGSQLCLPCRMLLSEHSKLFYAVVYDARGASRGTCYEIRNTIRTKNVNII